MGSRGAMNKNGGFNTPLEFHAVGKVEYYLDGRKMSVKILEFTSASNRKLPESSNTSDAYVSFGVDGKPKQLRVYDHRIAVFDVDFDHRHHYGLKEGQYHVHRISYATINGKEKMIRSRDSPDLSPDELKRWGSLINKLMRLRND